MRLVCLFVATALSCRLLCMGTALAQMPTPEELRTEQNRLELEVQDTNRQMQSLSREMQQRWSDERDKIKGDRDRAWADLKDTKEGIVASLKDDRDKAWNLYTYYIFSLIGGATIAWSFLFWWTQSQKNNIDQKISDLDQRLAQLPILHDNVRTFIDDIARAWPATKSNIRELQSRIELGQLKTEAMLGFLRNAKGVLDKPIGVLNGVDRDQMVESEIENVTMMMRLLSGEARYVHQAVNVLVEGDLPDVTRRLLPRLREIYRNFDSTLESEIDRLIATHGTFSAEQT